VRLEHGHRLLAGVLGIFTAYLFAVAWGSRGSFLPAGLVLLFGISCCWVSGIWGTSLAVHLCIWSSVLAFVGHVLFRGSCSFSGERSTGSLSLVAFLLVCFQGVLGGMRVVIETGGNVAVASVLRVVHGCTAQAFLACVVWICATESFRVCLDGGPLQGRDARALRLWPMRLVSISILLVYFQLIVGATMRHYGAGLAIPSFPFTGGSGELLPRSYDFYSMINFSHTRVGAGFASLVVLLGCGGVLFSVRGRLPRARKWALGCAVIVLLQVALGILVVLHQKPRSLATVHVVLGAALLASLVVLRVSLRPQFISGRRLDG
jgi:heme A synthase